jgi:pimeloyl-ACP methyl ester carboxylesterase
MTIDAGGPVHVADFGGSGPAMLLVHGLGGSHVNWMSVAGPLTERFHVYAPDLPGFGLTPLAGRPATIAANVRLLDTLMERLSDRPVMLMGNSMGGLLSLGVAAGRSDRLAGLVLVDPALPLPRGERIRLDRVTRAFLLATALPGPAARGMERVMSRMGPERLVLQTLELCSVDPRRIDQAVVDAHVALEKDRMRQERWPLAFFMAARSIVGTLALKRHIEDWIARVTVPTLLLHGTLDRVVSVRAARAAADLRPDWEYQEFGDAGHIPMLEVPDEFLRAVCGWLDRRRSASEHAGARSMAGSA